MSGALAEWWSARTARERALLGALAVFTAVLFLSLMIVRPLLGWRAAAAEQAAKRETEFRLVSDAARLAAAAPAGDRATPTRTALNAAAAAAGVEFSFVNNRDDGAVEAQVNAVAPQKLFAMLTALERDYGVRPVTADIARASDGSTDVRAQLTLAR